MPVDRRYEAPNAEEPATPRRRIRYFSLYPYIVVGMVEELGPVDVHSALVAPADDEAEIGLVDDQTILFVAVGELCGIAGSWACSVWAYQQCVSACGSVFNIEYY